MEAAMKDHSILRKDDEARRRLANHFRYTGKFGTVIHPLYSSRHMLKGSFSAIASKAHYIVVASQFMRPDQVRFVNGNGVECSVPILAFLYCSNIF
jgi:hypothetical protein